MRGVHPDVPHGQSRGRQGRCAPGRHTPQVRLLPDPRPRRPRLPQEAARQRRRRGRRWRRRGRQQMRLLPEDGPQRPRLPQEAARQRRRRRRPRRCWTARRQGRTQVAPARLWWRRGEVPLQRPQLHAALRVRDAGAPRRQGRRALQRVLPVAHGERQGAAEEAGHGPPQDHLGQAWRSAHQVRQGVPHGRVVPRHGGAAIPARPAAERPGPHHDRCHGARAPPSGGGEQERAGGAAQRHAAL